MKNRFVIWTAAALMAAVLFWGCGSSGPKIDLSQWEQEDGTYQCGELAWGSSKEDVEKTLDIQLTEPEFPLEQEGVECWASETPFTWNGHETLAQFEFYEDSGLFAVEFVYQDSESENLSKIQEELTAAMEKEFGEPTETKETDLGSSMRWETALEDSAYRNMVQIGIFGKNGETQSIAFGLVRPKAPEPRTEE